MFDHSLCKNKLEFNNLWIIPLLRALKIHLHFSNNADTGKCNCIRSINKLVDKSYTFSAFYTFINLKPLYTLGIYTEQICVIWHKTNTFSWFYAILKQVWYCLMAQFQWILALLSMHVSAARYLKCWKNTETFMKWYRSSWSFTIVDVFPSICNLLYHLEG